MICAFPRPGRKMGTRLEPSVSKQEWGKKGEVNNAAAVRMFNELKKDSCVFFCSTKKYSIILFFMESGNSPH